jgi:glycosyltransferase involved in cell wall biosynthesis
MQGEGDRSSSDAMENGPEITRILYIAYDGLTDPLGRSQVLPYLTALGKLGHGFTIISCEKPDRFDRDGELIEKICADAGIAWHPLPYHKRPPVLSSAWDMAATIRLAYKLQRSAPFDLVHCRSYMPAIAGLRMKRKYGTKFLFDMRAFWADERVEGGQWRLDRLADRTVYRYFKRKERTFFREADHIVSLTEAGKKVILEQPNFESGGPPVSVIPCCVDFDHFTPASPAEWTRARAELAIGDDEKVVVFLGSLGSLSMLEEMLDFFRVFREREPKACFLLITPESPEPIVAAARERGLEPEFLRVRSASRDEVPFLAGAADFGLFFVRPVPSKKGGSPTKMGELLALGLPIATNSDVGDVEHLLAELEAGAIVHSFSDASYREALDRLDAMPFYPEGIRERARARFDLAAAVERYDTIYRDMLRLPAARS